MHTYRAFLLLGSNIGDRKNNLLLARNGLSKLGRLGKASKIYETAPWGNLNQEPFLNQAIELKTGLDPHPLLENILRLEELLGRVRTKQWEPRIIDIDILLVDDIIMNDPQLRIPHAELANRNFALVPLMEIAGSVMHPVLEQTIEDLYFEGKDDLDVLIFDEK
jgi:2-amino-4-hydroxy-6-hydroxymethyldihydropteridine diphosphokinase